MDVGTYQAHYENACNFFKEDEFELGFKFVRELTETFVVILKEKQEKGWAKEELKKRIIRLKKAYFDVYTRHEVTERYCQILQQVMNKLNLAEDRAVRLVKFVRKRKPKLSPMQCVGYAVNHFENQIYYLFELMNLGLLYFNLLPQERMKANYEKLWMRYLFKNGIVKLLTYAIRFKRKMFIGSRRVCLVREMKQLARCLFHLSTSQMMRGGDALQIMKFLYATYQYPISLRNSMSSVLKPEEITVLCERFREISNLAMLTMFNLLDPYSRKWDPVRISFSEPILSDREDVLEFFEGKLLDWETQIITEEDEDNGIDVLIPGSPLRRNYASNGNQKNYPKSRFVVKKNYSYFNGIFSFVCAVWSIVLNEKFLKERPSTTSGVSKLADLLKFSQELSNQKQQPEFQFRTKSVEYLRTAIDNHLFAFLRAVVKNSRIFERREGVPGSVLETNFFLNTLSLFNCYLFVEKPSDRLHEEGIFMYKLLKDEEEETRDYRLALYQMQMQPQHFTEANLPEEPVAHFESVMDYLYVFFQKQPRFAGKITDLYLHRESNKKPKEKMGGLILETDGFVGLEYFVFTRSAEFVSDICRVCKDLHPAFDFYVRTLSAISGDEHTFPAIHTLIFKKAVTELFSWTYFNRLIKTVVETKRVSPPVDEKIVSILKLIRSMVRTNPEKMAESALRPQNLSDFKFLPILFRLTTITDSSPLLVGHTCKTVASFVANKKVARQFGTTIWAMFSSLKVTHDDNLMSPFIFQMERVEKETKVYRETIGILTLLESLTRNGIPINTKDSLSFFPYYWVIENRIMSLIETFSFKDIREKWKIVKLCLDIYINLIKDYEPSVRDFASFSSLANESVDESSLIYFQENVIKKKKNRNSSFEIMRKMLTLEDNFLFRIPSLFQLTAGFNQSRLFSKEKRVAVCAALKFITKVLEKQEGFRFHALRDQRGFPIAFSNTKQFFRDEFLFMLLFNFSEYPDLVKHSLLCLRQLSSWNNEYSDIFISRERHHDLMDLFIAGLTNPDLSDELMDVLLLNNRLTLFLCGFLHKEHYPEGNIDRNCLNIILKRFDVEFNRTFDKKAVQLFSALMVNHHVKKRVLKIFDRENLFEFLSEFQPSKDMFSDFRIYRHIYKILAQKVFQEREEKVDGLLDAFIPGKVINLMKKLMEFKETKPIIEQLNFIEDSKYLKYDEFGVKQYSIKKIHLELNDSIPLKKILELNIYNKQVDTIEKFYKSLCDFMMVVLSRKDVSTLTLKFYFSYLDTCFGVLNRSVAKHHNHTIEILLVRMIFKVFERLVKEQEEDMRKERLPKNQCINLLENIANSLKVIGQKARTYMYLVIIHFIKYCTHLKHSEFRLQINDVCGIIFEDALNARKSWKIVALSCLNYLSGIIEPEGVFLERIVGVLETTNDVDELVVIMHFLVMVYNRHCGMRINRKVMSLVSGKFATLFPKLMRDKLSLPFFRVFIPLMKLVNNMQITFQKTKRDDPKRINRYIPELERFFVAVLKGTEYSKNSLEAINLVYLHFFSLSFIKANLPFLEKLEPLMINNFRWFLEKRSSKKDDEEFCRRAIEGSFIAYVRNRQRKDEFVLFSHIVSRRTILNNSKKESVSLLFFMLKNILKSFNRHLKNEKKDQIEVLVQTLENLLFVLFQNLNYYLKERIQVYQIQNKSEIVLMSQVDKETLRLNCSELIGYLKEIQLLIKRNVLDNEYIRLCTWGLVNLISKNKNM